MCSSAAITASAAEAEDGLLLLQQISQARFQPTVHQRFQLTLLQKLKQAMLLSLMLKKSGWNNVKTVFCHIWKADGSGDWPAGSQRKKNVSTTLQQVSLHMIFQ